jgi:hypothetical protein
MRWAASFAIACTTTVVASSAVAAVAANYFEPYRALRGLKVVGVVVRVDSAPGRARDIADCGIVASSLKTAAESVFSRTALQLMLANADEASGRFILSVMVIGQRTQQGTLVGCTAHVHAGFFGPIRGTMSWGAQVGGVVGAQYEAVGLWESDTYNTKGPSESSLATQSAVTDLAKRFLVIWAKEN